MGAFFSKPDFTLTQEMYDHIVFLDPSIAKFLVIGMSLDRRLQLCIDSDDRDLTEWEYLQLRSQDNLLMMAADRGNVQMILSLLEWGADVNQQNLNSDTALHRAVSAGHINAVSTLLQNGANIEAQNGTTWTPLITGISMRNCAVVEELILRGANINYRDLTGRSPIYYAMLVKNADIVLLLLKHYVDVDPTDPHIMQSLRETTDHIRNKVLAATEARLLIEEPEHIWNCSEEQYEDVIELYKIYFEINSIQNLQEYQESIRNNESIPVGIRQSLDGIFVKYNLANSNDSSTGTVNLDSPVGLTDVSKSNDVESNSVELIDTTEISNHPE